MAFLNSVKSPEIGKQQIIKRIIRLLDEKTEATKFLKFHLNLSKEKLSDADENRMLAASYSNIAAERQIDIISLMKEHHITEQDISAAQKAEIMTQ